MKIAHVSTFPPMRCGIAFFVSDLIESMIGCYHHKYVLHYGRNQTGDAAGEANVSKPHELRELARLISSSECDVVSLQHEFGIWGGENGENIVPFLEHVSIPVVSTLHTTYRMGQPATRTALLKFLVNKSAVTIALSGRSKAALCDLLGLSERAVRVIPHGIPDMRFVPPPEGMPERRIISVGFFRPDKGLEILLRAIRTVIDTGIPCHYTIAGSPQPQFPQQDSYFWEIKRAIMELGLEGNIALVGSFLTRLEQVECIRKCHIGAFAYQDPEHASSGAVALALAAGRPVVCTPFDYAKAACEIGASVHLTRDFGPNAMSETLIHLFQANADWKQLSRLAYKATRGWTWPTVGRLFSDAMQEARHSLSNPR